MLAVLGVALLCLAALWFAAILPVYRRPVPPRWATLPLIAELMTVGILSVGVFGLAFLVQFALSADLRRLGLADGLLDGVLILAVLALATLLWRRLRARGLHPPGATPAA